MTDYRFDGTYIDFDLVIADASGTIPQPGMATGLTMTLYDSADNADAATIAVSEIASKGVYKIRTTYAELNRAAGDGLWRWTFSHTNPDLSFEPMAVSILINVSVGSVNNATFTPTTTEAEFDLLKTANPGRYIDSWINVISDTNDNIDASRQITASVLSNSKVKLTWTPALPAVLANSAKVIIINK